MATGKIYSIYLKLNKTHMNQHKLLVLKKLESKLIAHFVQKIGILSRDIEFLLLWCCTLPPTHFRVGATEAMELDA